MNIMPYSNRWNIFYKLNTKITVAIVTSLLAVLGTSTYIVEDVQRKDTLMKAEEAGFFISSTLLSNLEYHMIKNDRIEIIHFMEAMNKSREIETASIIKEDGQIVYSTNQNSVGMKISPAFISNFTSFNKEQVVNQGFKSGKRVLSVITTISNRKECFSCHDRNRKFLGLMLVDISMAPTEKLIIENRNRLIFSSFIAIVSVSLILFFLNNRFIYKPVRKLKKVIDRVKQGDLTIYENYPIKDEIGHLGDNLNAMVASLNEANKKLRESYRKQLHQSEKLAAIGQLTSAITHEIQSPLTGIYSSLKVIQSSIKDDPETKNILERILVNINNLMGRASEILKFVKPSAPQRETANLHDLLNDALFFVEKHAEKQGINIRMELADSLPMVQADLYNLEHVFLNLFLNAVQAMPDGGSLKITSGISADNKGLYVSFADSGTGISADETDKIFDPFYTTKKNGTGLGLYISRDIIEAHGGKILIETESGKGSNFTVWLPLNNNGATGC